MKDLLSLAIEAHGGLERWSRVKAVTVAASVTGETWKVKGRPDYLKDVVFDVETMRQRVTVDFVGQDKRSVFEPNRVEIRRRDGTFVGAREDPEASLQRQGPLAPWDDLDIAYFSGEALYAYVNTPFLYTYAGFTSEEIAPIRVDGEDWRRLRVTFPDTVKSHTRTQISCFGSDGMLRRHDYVVDILAGTPGLNYASDYREVDGIIFPTTRRVYAYEDDYRRAERLLVQIIMGEITLHR